MQQTRQPERACDDRDRLLTEREREKQRESTKQEFRERERVVRVYFVGRVDG